MNKLCMTCATALLLAAGGAFADDASTVRTHVLEVKQRLAHLERIDVTAEKPVSSDAEQLDEELLAILDDVALIENQPAAAESR
ncbi:MAG: hypothetical protein RIC56_11175 [Pseudomonadales bacterium]